MKPSHPQPIIHIEEVHWSVRLIDGTVYPPVFRDRSVIRRNHERNDNCRIEANFGTLLLFICNQPHYHTTIITEAKKATT
jgi:hypothetical protein